MDKKIILSLLVVALIGIVAATYQINNGVDILNPLSNVEVEDTPVTETLEAPAEAATSLDKLANDGANDNKDQAKASDTEVENSEPVNKPTDAAKPNGSTPNATSTANASNANNASNDASNAPSTSSSSGPSIQIGSAGNDSAVVEGRPSGSDSSSGSSSGQSSGSQPSDRIQPNSAANTQSSDSQTDDNDGEISIDAARSLVEQFILNNWNGNKVTLSYGTTVINDYGDKCYIYNMINDAGVQEGQASYNLRNKTIEIMDNSGSEYLSEVAM